MNGTGEAFLLDGTTLYVGGAFSQTDDGAVTNLNNIARYDLASGTWSALGNNGVTTLGFPGLSDVRALALVGSDLYVGGYFDHSADLTVANLNHIARYDTLTNTWSALAHNGLNGGVQSMLLVGNDLYMVGAFTQTDDGVVTNLNGIARYDTTTDTWNALSHGGLGGGLSSANVLALDGNELYIGGQYTQTADGAVTNLNFISRYNISTNTWSALANQGLNGDVRGLAVIGSDLYVGGTFNFTGDLTMGNLVHVARYDLSSDTWNTVANNGLNNGATVETVVAAGNDLYVGGYIMTQTNDGAVTNLNDIAYYDTLTNTWSALPNNGLDDHVLTLYIGAGRLFVGGTFTQSFDGLVGNLNGVAILGGDSPPQVVSVSPSGSVSSNVTSVQFHFSENVSDPAGDTGSDDVTNPANYLLVTAGPNGIYDTTGCAGVAGDDVVIVIGPVSYDSSTFISTVTVNAGVPLSLGEYRGFVCGTTSVVDPFSNPLGGGVDYIYDFSVVQAPEAAPALPATGFPPGRVSLLADQPAEKSYANLGDLWLEIPTLDVESSIVGVPQTLDGWDVSWLGEDVGWLQGTAFPTWAGNTALTAHVYDANGQPGPFVNLDELHWGQKIVIHAWGQEYTYEVRTVSWWTRPTDLRAFRHEKYDWITLVTCRGYDDEQDRYRWRTVVRAVLVDVEP